jgi:hypothetical protein
LHEEETAVKYNEPTIQLTKLLNDRMHVRIELEDTTARTAIFVADLLRMLDPEKTGRLAAKLRQDKRLCAAATGDANVVSDR